MENAWRRDQDRFVLQAGFVDEHKVTQQVLMRV